MIGLFAPLAALAANEVRGRVRRQAKVAAGYGVAALGGLGLLVVALISLHRYLGLLWGPFLADLAIGGLFLVIVASGLIYASAQSSEPEPTPAQEDAQRAAMSAAAVSAAPVALSMMKRGGALGVLGAVAAVAVGVFAGRAMSKRE